MTDLDRQYLLERLLHVTKTRGERIGELRDEMQRINAEYDREVLRLNRLIAKTTPEPVSEPKTSRKRASPGVPLPEGDELAKLIERYGK